MKIFIVLFAIVFVLAFLFKEKSETRYAVGVARSQIQSKIDLTNQLDPQILPSILEEVLSKITVKKGIKSEEFQKQVVQRLSYTILNDPEANYRIDLNEDGVIDPLMIVPEAIDGEAVIYSLRVPDPEKFPKDPSSDADWEKVAEKQSIEIVEVNLTLSTDKNGVVIASNPNGNVYQEKGNQSYQSNYSSSGHSWIATYFQYRLFSAMLFGPYGWGFGSFYGGFYNGSYNRVATSQRSSQTSSRYNKASASSSQVKSPSGQTVRSKKGVNRSNSSIRKLRSKRNVAVRSPQRSNRSGGFGRYGSTNRSRSSVFSGGGSRGGWGK